MKKVYKRPAKEVGIRVGYHRGFEHHGRTFITVYDSDSIGGQCTSCHAIIWTAGSSNAILRQPKPAHVPESGAGYKEFVLKSRLQFLLSLSPCPQCGAINSFNLFVNNITPTRYEDGAQKDASGKQEFYDTPNKADAWVWWAEF